MATLDRTVHNICTLILIAEVVITNTNVILTSDKTRYFLEGD
jgi:hypothetical protein